jgi:hypothetical protein
VSRAKSLASWRITRAGYHQPSAQDAGRKIAAFFDAHLKTRADAGVMPAPRST